jgi:hypothetical protein
MGNLNVTSKITTTTPTSNNHVATKWYVDAEILWATSWLTGGDDLWDHLATTDLNLNWNSVSMGGWTIYGLADPVWTQQAATKSYVDTQIDQNTTTCTTMKIGNDFAVKVGTAGAWDTSRLNSSKWYMIEGVSLSKRCQQMGYDFGISYGQWWDHSSPQGWCNFSNVGTAYWSPQYNGWVSDGCTNNGVALAKCCNLK